MVFGNWDRILGENLAAQTVVEKQKAEVDITEWGIGFKKNCGWLRNLKDDRYKVRT